MNVALQKSMRERIGSALQRKSVTSCSRWTEKYRIMGGSSFPGPWKYDYHPWLKEMHDTNDPWVGRKSAQMGFTECVLNRAFYCIDILNWDVLYVLPNKIPDATDFSAARFDAALELSPHIDDLFSNVRNVGHKRAGACNLYIRGSRSRSGLKSLPAPLLIFDERDEMAQAQVILALERSSGQMEKQTIQISTPTIDNYGIDKEFQDTTKEHFYFACPSCSRHIELSFPDCLVITAEQHFDVKINDSYLICPECKSEIPHKEKHKLLQGGSWVPSVTNNSMRGFYINQLYSSTVTPAEIAKMYLKSMYDPAEEQEFYNSKLGLPHIVEGARIDDKNLDDCLATYCNGEGAPSTFTTIGIDVGKFIHYEVDTYSFVSTGGDVHLDTVCTMLECGKVKNFDELDSIMLKYRPQSGVIDANPERREAKKFANRFKGIVKLCFYGNKVNGKSIHEGEDDYTPTVTVDRTSWLDTSLGRYSTRRMNLPADVPLEYRDNVKALVRIMRKDREGNPVASYMNTGPDHFGHSRNYNEIALKVAMAKGSNQDMENPS